jgi:hypothetical protein
VTTFSESQNRHKCSHLWPSQCDGFCNIKAGRHKKSQKELAKTSRIVVAFNRHKTVSQMVTIVTVTMRYLGEGVFAFHTLMHNISFRFSDCNSKLSVQLKNVPYVGIATDASNHFTILQIRISNFKCVISYNNFWFLEISWRIT